MDDLMALPERPTTVRRRIATSRHPAVTVVRRIRDGWGALHLPLPRLLNRAVRGLYVVVRGAWAAFMRVFVVQPILRASCERVGRRLRTGSFVHWVEGPARMVLGDDVTLDGKSTFQFATRFSDRPTLTIGSRTMIGHGCTLVIGKDVTIGEDCLIASSVHILDTSAHPLEPSRRLAKEALRPDEVKPVRIGNNVWIGAGAVILPGVTVGDGAVVAAHAVVSANVAPNTLVAGYPARRLQVLESPAGDAPEPARDA